MERRDEELAELGSRARQALERAEELEPLESIRGCRPEIRLWCYPSFFEYRSWTVFSGRSPRDGEARLLVRRVTWNSPSDRLRLRDPMEGLRQGFHTVPSLSVADTPIPEAEYRAVLNAGRSLRLPLMPGSEGVMIDGTMLGLEMELGFRSIRLEWAGSMSEQWEELTEWAEQLREFFERCIAASESE